MTAPHADRRTFLKSSAAAGAGAALGTAPLAAGVHGGVRETLRLGLIGCGGRGTGAAHQALSTEGDVELVAVGDVFSDRAESSLRNLRKGEVGSRVKVDAEHTFIGFDAYRKVLASDVDVVILATPPHFRPDHFDAAVAANKHVFFEKPVAVDGWGVRKVLAAAGRARQQGLAVGCGLQRHHQRGYREAIARVHDGAIGDIVAARCYWNMGSLWMKERRQEWSDMEWQLRNWLYFTWLSGDHITEQHVHNLDVVNWAVRGHPVRCHGMGGRQVRTGEEYGHIFDHHAVHYEFADGAWMFSQCRQIPGCRNEVAEHLIGTEGRLDVSAGGPWRITGKAPWEFEGRGNNPYQTEHDDLFAAIRSGTPYDEGVYVAESTLTAIMGRMATYTGKEITWEEALDSPRLGPEEYAFGGLPVPKVPVPGRG